MGFILWILYGLCAGACASWLLGSTHEWYWNIIIGIVGSIVACWVSRAATGLASSSSP